MSRSSLLVSVVTALAFLSLAAPALRGGAASATATASSGSVTALFQSAKRDFSAGDYATASAKFEELVKRGVPSSILRETPLSLCESKLREGKLVEAETLAVKAATILTDKTGLPEIKFMRAEILYFSGNLKEALDHYLAFVGSYVEHPLANDAIARMLLMDENSEANNEPLVTFIGAEYLEYCGAGDSALVVLDSLLTAFPEARIVDEAQFKKGEILSACGKYAEAVEQYRLLGVRFRDSELVPLSRLRMAKLLSEKLGEKAGAIAECEEVVKAFPETSFAVEARDLLQRLKK
ncbi:MAG: tetratricopeptide repeat protein [Candidatus Eisenbacteria bacterium]